MARAIDTATALPVAGIRELSSLRPEVEALREAALREGSKGVWTVPTWPIVDARAWAERAEGEDWLVWRGRRTAARLRAMPFVLSAGERIAGRPDLRAPTPEEARQIDGAKETLKAIPAFPGGDAGHFHPDFDRLFRAGIRGLQEEIGARMAATADAGQRAFYRACGLAMEGFGDYIRNVAEACSRMAASNGAAGARWEELSRICRKVATEPPGTFHEAIQLMFLTIVALWFGEDHGLTSPGRMDQTLRRFYEADVASGRIAPEEALELICCLYIQLNRIAGPGLAISVLVGGRDRDGQDATNDLTYLCLAARTATRLVYPTVGLAWHEGTPTELSDFGCRTIATGIGDPAFFNDELIAQGLRDHGVSVADSFDYMNSTCVEIKAVGASNIWVTQPYFNCPQALLETMEGIADGTAPEPATFEGFNALVQARMAATVREAAERLDGVWRRRAEAGCFPLASCFTRDCIARGMDFDRGGARYNWVENSFVGLANLTDGLMAIRQLVYDSGELSLRAFRAILRADYAGCEPLRQRILHGLPRYGNDDDEVDAIAAAWADFLGEMTATNRVGLHPYVPGFFCWIVHERFGAQTGATPDGRKAGFPLADGAGAAQGREAAGPTASVLSTTKWSHRKAIGGLVHNVKFSRQALRTGRDLTALRHLIETYLRRGGFEIQVNAVSADVLRDAQAHPEKYADLLVRVAGYSDYFVHLNPNMQAEIIARTEHVTV